MDAKSAQTAWEKANNIHVLSADEVYRFDAEKYKDSLKGDPWKKDPHFFKKVKISAVSLLKMVMHARSGGSIEVMGVMQGRVEGDTFYIMDSFALPVEATEVRVNAGAEAYEYMAQFLSLGEAVSRPDNLVGWYHSHPGYGCWLSGIDVNTQLQNQSFQDPWLAIVVDPVRTISSGQVQIGAFRTYPKDYTPPDSVSEYQTIPLEKIEDFGVHCKAYYQLEVSVFKSSLDARLLDLLWNKYWVSTLSSSPTVTNREFASKQLLDLCGKLEQVESSLAQTTRMPGDKKESQLSKLSKDCCKAGVEQVNGIMTQVIKHALFNASAPAAAAAAPARS